ncbi:hypothetical protein HKX48_004443 [Thoreauomyces humboldtii]|nr:hypothetical protein HKX48_004443 [Thoreauomyces humboldtii]
MGEIRSIPSVSNPPTATQAALEDLQESNVLLKDELHTKTKLLAQSNARSTQLLETINSQQSFLQTLAEQLTRLQQNQETRRATDADRRAAEDDARACRVALDEAHDRLQERDDHVRGLEKKLEAAIRETARLRSAVAAGSQEIESLRGKMHDYDRREAEREDVLRGEVGKLRKYLAFYRRENQQLRSDGDRMRKKVALMRSNETRHRSSSPIPRSLDEKSRDTHPLVVKHPPSGLTPDAGTYMNASQTSVHNHPRQHSTVRPEYEGGRLERPYGSNSSSDATFVHDGVRPDEDFELQIAELEREFDCL